MPIRSITTTAQDVFFGDESVDSLNFKNGSATGTIFLRNKSINDNTVTSTDFEWSLPPGGSLGLTRINDGAGIQGSWQAISDTGGGVTLEILPVRAPGKGKH